MEDASMTTEIIFYISVGLVFGLLIGLIIGLVKCNKEIERIKEKTGYYKQTVFSARKAKKDGKLW